MAPYDPNERDRMPPPPPPGGAGGPEDPVVYPAAEDRRAASGSSPDDAHRRAAFGRRPTDVPASYEPRRSVLPYVIGLLLLVALVPIAMHLRGRNASVARGTGSDTATVAAGGEVGEVGAPADAKERFAEWAAEGGAAALPQEAEENHPYTSQGIRLLADALTGATSGSATKVADARQRIDDLRVQADRLQSSPGQDRHAEYAHAALASAATLIGEIQAARHTATNDAAALTAAADAVKPDQPLSPQGERVRRFFRMAAKALP